MKKSFIWILLILCGIQLVACRNDESSAKKPQASATSMSKNAASSKTRESSTSETSTTTTAELSDSEFENDNYKFVIQDTEQIKDNSGNLPLLVLKLEFTNKSEQPISPWMAFITSISATQKDGDQELTLNGANGLFPADYQPEIIKANEKVVPPGETVETIIGFVIERPGIPVELSDLNLLEHSEIFERSIPTME